MKILQRATSTSTQTCHLGCPEHSSRADSAVGNADLNANLPPQLPRMQLSWRCCCRQRRPQCRSATSDAENAMPMPTLHSTTSATQSAVREHSEIGDTDPCNANPNSELPPRMSGEPVLPRTLSAWYGCSHAPYEHANSVACSRTRECVLRGICRQNCLSTKRLKTPSWLLTEEILQVVIATACRNYLTNPLPPRVQGWGDKPRKRRSGGLLNGINFASCQTPTCLQH